MIRQGGVYDYHLGPRGRVVILSSDRTNHEAYPIAARLLQRAGEVPPYLVGLSDADPIAGAVDIATLSAIDPAGLTEPVCLLTGGTIARIVASVQDLFEME